MGYFELFLSNRKLLTFGILLTFFSGFGKTFLISLYIPFFIAEFELTKTSFSALYAFTTIASGIFILYLGSLIDKTKLKYYSLMVALGLIASCILLNVAYNVWLLAIGLFGLRLSGQGLMIHTSVTAIARYFNKCRGKAISIAFLGHPLGESILPVCIALLIGIAGWRNAILFSGDLIALVLLPMVLLLLRSKPKVVERQEKRQIKAAKGSKAVKKISGDWSLVKMLKDKRFYFLAPSILCLAGVNTGLMFYMIPIAEHKGWTAEWMALSFIGFAIGNSTANLTVGPLVDRYRASRIFPFYILPLALGMSMMLIFSSPFYSIFYLALSGLAIGAGINLEASMVAEVYGIKNYGKVRTVFTALNIFSTALAPFAMALVLDAGYTFNSIFIGCILLVLVSSILATKLYPKKVNIRGSLYQFREKLQLRRTNALYQKGPGVK